MGPGLLDPLDRRELHRLLSDHHPGDLVADDQLHRREDRRDRERDQEPEAVVAVVAAPQHADRVDAGDEEARSEIGSDDHVGELPREGRREDRRPDVDVLGKPVGSECEALRGVQPRVGGDDAGSAEHRHERDRHSRPEVRSGAEPVPAVDVDGDEDRLEEERARFDVEPQAEHVAELAHEAGPEEPELERQHRAGDRADGEGHRHDLRPATGQEQRDVVPLAHAAPVRDQCDGRERHAEWHQQDVKAQREGHHLACREQVGRRLRRQNPYAHF